MYVPVLLAAWAFGPAGGALAGVAAGVAVGPGMPLDADAGVAQTTAHWVYRLGFFVLIGVLSGGLHQRTKAQLAQTRAERRRFASLMEHAPDVVVTCNVRGLVGYASPSVTRVLGYPVESVVNRPFGRPGPHRRYRCCAPDDGGAHGRSWVTGGAARAPRRRVLAAPGDGHRQPAGRPLAAVVCSARDVTEWRANESELRRGWAPGDLLARFATTALAVLCPSVDNHDGARRITERLLQAVEEPFLMAHGEVHLSPASG